MGHGAGSFSFEVCERALEQGVVPGTISTDLHQYNVHGPVFDLATTLSKFLHLGLTLEEVGDLTGYSVSMWSRVERSERAFAPDAKILIARRLGVLIRELFPLEEEV